MQAVRLDAEELLHIDGRQRERIRFLDLTVGLEGSLDIVDERLSTMQLTSDVDTHAMSRRVLRAIQASTTPTPTVTL